MGQITASEFTTAAGEHQYILSSSTNSVEHDALRELFEQHGRTPSPASHQESGKPDTGGRGAVSYLDLLLDENPTPLVLRHYQRGGLVAKLTRTKYLWHGLAKTRAVTELGLLDHLCQQQLPVCKPFAAQVLRRGLNYECSLLTHEIVGAATMGSLLQSEALTTEQWSRIGKVIRQMHDLQVYHADLNAHNIMLAENKAFLIDFDRGEQRAGGSDAWKAANLQRLHRSVLKLQNQYGFSFDTKQWQVLQNSYKS